jgi:hypothetical protein
MATHLTVLLALVFLQLIPVCPVLAQAQPKPAGAAKSALCNRVNALELIKQQAEAVKSYNNASRQITVLVRAADLLWPYEQRKARAVFTEAFDLAIANEKEKASTTSPSVIVRMQTPDQRYVVISAIAKRDSVWARELTQQMLKSATDTDGSSTRSSLENVLAAQRLLDAAYQLIAVDLSTALNLARISLSYPAGFMLTRFLYGLAAINQQAADQFYAQALGAYSEKPLREFLYLQAYPFAWRDITNTPIFSHYEVPPSFVTNQSLQRRFMEILLRRAQQALEAPVDEGDGYQNNNGIAMPATAFLLQGLMRLEPEVRGSLPDLLAPLTQAREKILVSLSVENQRLLVQPGREASTPPDQTFAERVESAQKEADADERDQLIAAAVLSETSKNESLASVIQAIDKISDSSLRSTFTEWLYFQRAITAIKDKRLEEAERLATQIEEPQERAHLRIEMAKVLLKTRDAQTQAQELLEQAISEAKKTGKTIFAARTLLTAAALYTQIDLSRSVSVLADAINLINGIETPDFFSDGQALEKTPARKGKGGQYAGEYLLRFYMPGLDPEAALRELAKFDFDTALSESSSLSDKPQRAMSMMAVTEVCLQQTPQRPREKPTKNGKP